MFQSQKKKIFLKNSGSKEANKSRFRGISKIGKKWQVLMMVFKKKRYVGSYVSDEEAARIYDQYSIALFWIKAQPNFSYTKTQVEQILLSAES